MSLPLGLRAGATALPAILGLFCALVLASWPAATACFAVATAAALLRARTAERRERVWRVQSRRDPLTGVGNYRQLHEGLRKAVAADPQRFALLTMDVDSFKAINDEHGHLEGDRLLQEVSRALAANVRGTDLVARQGGDEFAVLAPETDAEGAALLAARIERALGRIEVADQRPVRASIGVALYPNDGATPDDLLERADAVLRATKASRRERAAA